MLDPARLHQLWTSAPHAFLIVDGAGTIRHVNPAAQALLASDLLDRPVAEVVSELVVPLAAAQRGATAECDIHLEQGGVARVLVATCWPCDASDDVAVALFDATAHAGRSDQRAQVRKMRALATMAGNLSHHFNNILGSAVTRIDFARQSNDIRVLRRCLDTTALALQRATHLLDGLLAFAEADYRDSDLADLTESLIDFTETLGARVKTANVVLDVRLAAVPVLPVPRSRFMTLLESLVDNALEAMPTGGQLTIELQGSEDRVICRIADDGPGIPEQDLDRVFEPFYSTKATLASKASSHAGLGLSVAVGIAHELGGDLLIASTASGGTTVEIHLPVDPRRPLHDRVQVAE